jgi:hypothetical protein
MQLLDHIVAGVIKTQLKQIGHPFIDLILHLHLNILLSHQWPLPQYVVY